MLNSAVEVLACLASQRSRDKTGAAQRCIATVVSLDPSKFLLWLRTELEPELPVGPQKVALAVAVEVRPPSRLLVARA